MNLKKKISDTIDILAVSSAPVAAWVAFGQAVHKPWAHSGFIILWGVSAGAWSIKTIIWNSLQCKLILKRK